MIRLNDKSKCCGCGACAQRCPKHCISLLEDKEGFLYPKIKIENCIDCKLCEKVCPIINANRQDTPIKVIAAKNRNESYRLDSSSGGVFISLAQQIIRQGGVVFGAVFDDKWEVKHIYIEHEEDIRFLMRSKYVQSRIENTFNEVKYFLEKQRTVLYVGTPCQIAALHRFLNKNYASLFTVDILCHGVPSPKVWRMYLKEKQTARSAADGKNTVCSSLKSMPAIAGVNFREKKMNGWKKYGFIIEVESADQAEKSVLSSNIFYNDVYMKGFLANLYLRPSCYHCVSKNGRSHSDLTIADCWGIDIVNRDFDDDKGVSLVMINTSKGENLFPFKQMNCIELELDRNIMNGNGGFSEDLIIPQKRDKFFNKLDSANSVAHLIETILRSTLWDKIKNRIKKK